MVALFSRVANVRWRDVNNDLFIITSAPITLRGISIYTSDDSPLSGFIDMRIWFSGSKFKYLHQNLAFSVPASRSTVFYDHLFDVPWQLLPGQKYEIELAW